MSRSVSDEARRLIAVDGGGQQNLRLVFFDVGVVGDDDGEQTVGAHDVGGWPEIHQTADLRVVGGKRFRIEVYWSHVG